MGPYICGAVCAIERRRGDKIEQSAGELFRALPDLAHSAVGENRSVQRYGELIAGGWCWVAGDRRGKGLGLQLLRSAEAEAIRRGCRLILLATHSFQAPDFYLRHGYRRFATIDGYPTGHSEIFVVKYL